MFNDWSLQAPIRRSPTLTTGVASSIVRAWGLGLAAMCCLVACGPGSRAQGKLEHEGKGAAVTREQAVYETLRSGDFQLGAASETIQGAYDHALKLRDRAPKKTDLRAALEDLVDFLDSAGFTVSNYDDMPESAKQVQENLKNYEAQVQTMVELASNARRDLDEAQEIADSLRLAAEGPAKDEFQELFDEITLAIEDVSGAVEALGGSLAKGP